MPLADQTEYAVEDADITLQLKEHFTKELESGNVAALFNDVELPLVAVLTAMEIEGININVAFLKELSGILTADIERLEKGFMSKQVKNLTLHRQNNWGLYCLKTCNWLPNQKRQKRDNILPLKTCFLSWPKTIKLLETFKNTVNIKNCKVPM